MNKSSATYFGTTYANTRHVASCGWWRGDGDSKQGHHSPNRNSPQQQVVAFVGPKCVALDLFVRNTYSTYEDDDN